MIRFCDKNVYTIYTYDLYRVEMLRFFLNEKDEFQRDVVMVLNADNSYYGIMTYPGIVIYTNPEERIFRESITVSEHLFEDAREVFKRHPKDLLPILDTEGNLCGFCYDDSSEYYEQYFNKIAQYNALEKVPVSFLEWQKCKKLQITDCNELAYECYRMFIHFGYPVEVVGEEWKWLGIQSEESQCLRSEKFCIYAEGISFFRWNWTLEERAPGVKDFFSWIYVWDIENRKHYYREVISFFEKKGISVYCCVAPNLDEIEWEGLELKAQFYQVSMEEAWMMGNKLNRKKKEILCEILGKTETEMLCDRKIEAEKEGFRRVSYTNLKTEVLEQAIGEKRIYLIGPCIVAGYGNLTENTLISRLQEKVGKYGYVVARMVFTEDTWPLWTEQEMAYIPLREQDIVIFIDTKARLADIECRKLDLCALYNQKGRKSWIVDNSSLHLNKEGITAITEEVYNKVLEKEIKQIQKTIKTNHFLQKGEILSAELQEQVREYAEKIRNLNISQDGKNIGSIVMNCNPFTYGHQYLIEYAASRVDELYVFVVEEDRSVFPFVLRKQMVEEGVKHLNNVYAVPSSEWVLSYRTFPVYFEKAELQEERVDTSMDLEIFARYIAPVLGITHRFVGEEPTDKITRQYNEQMKTILGEFGIHVEEVPRKEFKGNVISASYVRECIKGGQFEELKDYVPESTLNILREAEI